MKNNVINDLFDYPNMKIVQNDNVFKFSLDSILLAEFVNVKNNKELILDLCTGNAPIPLILSTKVDNKIIGFEIQQSIYDMAVESIKINNKEKQIKVINDDVKNIENYFPGNNFDIIVCNPPYFKYNESSLINKNVPKSFARHEIAINLEDIIKISAKYLNPNGQLYLVHRSERLDEIFISCHKNNIAIKKVQLINTSDHSDPNIVLIKAVKGGKSGVKVAAEINISKYKSYKNIFK